MGAFYNIFGLLIIVTSLLSISNSATWWIKTWDVSRAQLFVFSICTVLLGAFFMEDFIYLQWLIFSLLLVAATYHLSKIWHFTPLGKKEVLDATNPTFPITFYTANVRQKNDDFNSLIESIQNIAPDVVLLTETNQEWLNEVAALKNDYPHFTEMPLENSYGMALYSKFPFEKAEFKFLIDDEVPSVHAILNIKNQRVAFVGLHPKPPAPWTKDDKNKDRELLAVARMTHADKLPTVVSGDLNDVCWSDITQKFKKISGLKDPRVGRGFYSTYNANIPLARIPIDHFFLSAHFKLLKMRRLPYIGSDHFPVMVEVNLFQPD